MIVLNTDIEAAAMQKKNGGQRVWRHKTLLLTYFALLYFCLLTLKVTG